MAIAAAATWWLKPDVPRAPESAALKREPAPAAPPSSTVEQPAGDHAANSNGESMEQPAQTNAPTAASDPNNPFRVDAAGKLIVDEQTRLDIEALFARTDRDGLLKAQQEIVQQLPAAASAEAVALIERYDNYSKAQRQAYPPGVAPATEEAALAELEGLHALRIAHFGPDTAQAFYGNEEKLTRALLDLMRLEKDQSLTMEEKAARAQQLYDATPELTEPDNNSPKR